MPSIKDFIGPAVFTGPERMGVAICDYMCEGEELTELEKYHLFRYVGMAVPFVLKGAYRNASPSERETARKAMLVRFPKEWPPPGLKRQSGKTSFPAPDPAPGR